MRIIILLLSCFIFCTMEASFLKVGPNDYINVNYMKEIKIEKVNGKWCFKLLYAGGKQFRYSDLTFDRQDQAELYLKDFLNFSRRAAK